MKNLAGILNCDAHILQELEVAGVEPVPYFWELDSQGKEMETRKEVPYSVVGWLSGFTFERAWNYWIVTGLVPIRIAEVLYADEVGKKDVRVAGHCGRPPPREWAKWMRGGKEVMSIQAVKELEEGIPKMEPILQAEPRESPDNDYLKVGDGQPTDEELFVTLYHVDSQDGLNLLVRELKRRTRQRRTLIYGFEEE